MKNAPTSRRELNKVKCRVKILKASRRLFSANGYENTTLEEIANKAEISKATLRNYFLNKENLLIGIAEQEIMEARSMMENELKEIGDSKEKLKKILDKFILDALNYINLARKISFLTAGKDSVLYESRIEMMGIFQDIIREGQENGGFRKDKDVDTIAEIVMSIYFLALYGWRDIDTYTEEQCVDKIKKVFDISLKDVINEKE